MSYRQLYKHLFLHIYIISTLDENVELELFGQDTALVSFGMKSNVSGSQHVAKRNQLLFDGLA